MMADFLCGLAAGLLALELRFDATGSHPVSYLILSLGLPLIWLAFLALAGGYDKRFVGVGSDEFRRVLSAPGENVFDDPDSTLVPGTLGQAKIHLEWKSAAWWAWRSIASALDIGLW